MMVVVVLIDGLSFQARNGIKLFDLGRPQPCQGTENCTLDLRNLGILDSVDKSIPSTVQLSCLSSVSR